MTLFPAAKDDFTAENGVTYTWEDNRWRTKAYRLDDEALDDYLTKNNPRATGALTVSPVDWMEQSKFCVTNGSSAYFILKPSSTAERSQIQYWGMTEGDRDLATVGYVKGQLNSLGEEQIDYLPLTGGTMTGALQVTRPGITAAGQYVFSAKADGLPSDKSVAFRVTADGGVKAGHDTGTAFIAKANNDVVTKKFVDTNLVPSSGGTFTGQLTVKYSGGDVPRFVVSNGDFHSFFVQTNHMAHCRGRVYVNSYMEDGGGQTGDANKLATINEVKEIAAESGGGGKFIDNFDRGYTTVQGSSTAPLSFNTIALLDSDGLATKNFANISQVLMSWDQMNPEYITKTGHIKLTDEGSDILRGYLTVLDYKVSDGRNVAFQVMPGKYGGNTSEIGYGKRLSLTFNGALFGTYDPLWSPS